MTGLRGSQAQQRFGLGVELDDAALSGYTPLDPGATRPATAARRCSEAEAMDRTPAVPRFDNAKIVHVRGVDHPESLAVGPRGELYTTGTGCQVFRVDVATNRAEQFATTASRCLG